MANPAVAQAPTTPANPTRALDRRARELDEALGRHSSPEETVQALRPALADDIGRLASLPASERSAGAEMIALRHEFIILARTWRLDSAGHSISRRKTSHPAFRLIVEMGEPALPWILEEIERESGFWHLALEEITGSDAAARSADPQQAREAWLRWGRESGLIG